MSGNILEGGTDLGGLAFDVEQLSNIEEDSSNTHEASSYVHEDSQTTKPDAHQPPVDSTAMVGDGSASGSGGGSAANTQCSVRQITDDTAVNVDVSAIDAEPIVDKGGGGTSVCAGTH